MYGGSCTGSYVLGLIDLIQQLQKSGHSVVYDFVMNESLITRARNLLAHNFLQSDADVLLFIDADQGFNGYEVLKMIESGKKLIGAVSPMKGINWASAVNASKYGESDLEQFSGFFNVNFSPNVEEFSLAEPIEVENIGTGMMAIHREVFEKLSKKCEKYYGHGLDGTFKKSKENLITEFFKTEVDSNETLLSEDYYFCKLWKSAGKKVFIAPWVQLTHSGAYVFSGNFPKSVLLNKQIEESLKPLS
jgi:hypothetical protein